MGLGRYTACGFHLMRCAEIGLKAVARCLSIPDPTRSGDRNWGNILEKSIKPKMEELTKASKWSNSADKQFFKEVYASADAVRSAWRNSTMHVEKKYTEDEAEHVFSAVKGFMQKLADRMDQTGQPIV
jgi:HEPN domain-containing protein